MNGTQGTPASRAKDVHMQHVDQDPDKRGLPASDIGDLIQYTKKAKVGDPTSLDLGATAAALALAAKAHAAQAARSTAKGSLTKKEKG